MGGVVKTPSLSAIDTNLNHRGLFRGPFGSIANGSANAINSDLQLDLLAFGLTKSLPYVKVKTL